jgi:hypothetical protein
MFMLDNWACWLITFKKENSGDKNLKNDVVSREKECYSQERLP